MSQHFGESERLINKNDWITLVILLESMKRAAIAQLVERIHGKDEVSGSIPDRGSIFVSLPLAILRKSC